jgi:hypothetical protein
LLSWKLSGRPAEARTLLEKQAYVQQILNNRLVARILQTLTQFGGAEKYKQELKAVLSGE